MTASGFILGVTLGRNPKGLAWRRRNRTPDETKMPMQESKFIPEELIDELKYEYDL